MATPTYVVTVDLNGTIYSAQGKTVDEALTGLNLDYTQVKTKGTITLAHGKLQSQRFYNLPQMRRIVCSKLRKVQVAKDLAYLLK